jgi:protein-disulfide isomerase
MSEKGASTNPLEKFVPVLLLASIALAFVVGVLWQKVSSLEGGKTTLGTTADAPNDPGEQVPQKPEGKLSEEQTAKVPEVNDRDHIRGSKDAKVFLIEYSDYECPYCSRFHPTAQQVVDEFDGQVAWVYRHFPLDQLHLRARPAAEASECVSELGGNDAFWKFTDLLYEDPLKLSDLGSVAESSGVDKGAFENCMDSEKYVERVEEIYQGGLSSGVTGTPGNIIINDKGEAWLIPGALPFEQIKATIEEALSS